MSIVWWLLLLKIDTITRVQILDEVIYISHSAKALEKCLNLTILPEAIGKYWSILFSLTLIWKSIEENKNPKFKSAKQRLKIDLVPHPAKAERLIYIYIYI